MKQRIGKILIISGCILLLQPSLDIESMLVLHGILKKYWPIALIFIGISFLHKQPKKKSSKYRT